MDTELEFFLEMTCQVMLELQGRNGSVEGKDQGSHQGSQTEPWGRSSIKKTGRGKGGQVQKVRQKTWHVLEVLRKHWFHERWKGRSTNCVQD